MKWRFESEFSLACFNTCKNAGCSRAFCSKCYFSGAFSLAELVGRAFLNNKKSPQIPLPTHKIVNINKPIVLGFKMWERPLRRGANPRSSVTFERNQTEGCWMVGGILCRHTHAHAHASTPVRIRTVHTPGPAADAVAGVQPGCPADWCVIPGKLLPLSGRLAL